MGKRANNNPSGKGKKFAKQSADARGNSAEELVRRRVQTQRTRLQRALDKAKDDPELQAQVHIDGVSSHAAAAANGDELAIKCRLEHLNKLHKLVSFPSDTTSSSSSSSSSAATTATFSEKTITSTAALRPALVLALLDEGALADATEALDQWVPRDASNAASFATGRAATPLLFSRALCDFVAWRGAPGEDAPPEDSPENTGDKEDDMSPLEQAANLSFDRALEANVYVGVMLANLSIFLREIDPAIAAEAANVTPVVPDDDATPSEAASSSGSSSSSSGSNKSESTGGTAGSAKPSSDGSDTARGKFAGSVEEALAYAAGAGGCWMDLLEKGCEEWATSRVANFAFRRDGNEEESNGVKVEGGGEGRGSISNDEAEMGCVEWPPRRCSKAGARFVQLFVAAAETAEAEASEDEDDDDEDAEDKEELLSAISEGDEAAASDYEGR